MFRRAAAWLVLIRRRYWQRPKGYDRPAGLGLRPSRSADPQWRQRLQRLVQGRQSLPRVRQCPRASSSAETQVARRRRNPIAATASYIDNLARADDGRTQKFNIIWENPNMAKVECALEYPPTEKLLRLITI